MSLPPKLCPVKPVFLLLYLFFDARNCQESVFPKVVSKWPVLKSQVKKVLSLWTLHKNINMTLIIKIL